MMDQSLDVAEAMSRVPLRVHQDIILTDQRFIEGEKAEDDDHKRDIDTAPFGENNFPEF